MTALPRRELCRGMLATALLLALLAVGCGGSDETTSTATDTETTDDATSGSPSVSSDDETTSTTDDDVTTSGGTPEPTTTTTFPGDPIEFGPQAGDVLGVVGVAHDDTLNVRQAPGTGQAVVAELDPLAEDVLALGNTRSLPQSFWIEVDTGETTGWVSLSFVGYLGVVTDETARVISDLGETPTADDMETLGLTVSEVFATKEPESRVVVSAAPTVGDLGEVTIDVVGVGDDALLGHRLHVFGASEDGGATFGLKSVEVTALCGRGVTDDGLCV